MKDIMDGVKLSKDQCIVALDEGGTAWIVARSDFQRERDVIPECSAEDNGFSNHWDKGLAVGLYLLTIEAWGSGPDHNGEYDTGIDVTDVKPLWQVGQL